MRPLHHVNTFALNPQLYAWLEEAGLSVHDALKPGPQAHNLHLTPSLRVSRVSGFGFGFTPAPLKKWEL